MTVTMRSLPTHRRPLVPDTLAGLDDLPGPPGQRQRAVPGIAARAGDVGPVVADVRAKLALVGLLERVAAEGDPREAAFDADCENAVRSFQQQRGLTSDGIVGPVTYRSLDEARWRLSDRILVHQPSRQMVGDDVAALQRRLLDLGFAPGRVDGRFGPDTDAAVRDFQRNVGLGADGICGPSTYKAFDRLSRHVTGGSPDVLRERTVHALAGPALHGKIVVIDPGHGGLDRGVVRDELDEAALVEDLAARLEGRLAATGVIAYLTRPVPMRRSEPSAAEHDRAAFANHAGADLLVSLHVDGTRSPRPHGVAAYYYGEDRFGHVSAVGRRLAELVQREIIERTSMADCRTHAKTWDLLRNTRMPAIRVEVGYLSSLEDRERLVDPGFRDTVAEAIAVAVRRLYQSTEHGLEPEGADASGIGVSLDAEHQALVGLAG